MCLAAVAMNFAPQWLCVNGSFACKLKKFCPGKSFLTVDMEKREQIG